LLPSFDDRANAQVNCPVGRVPAGLFVIAGDPVKTFSPKPRDIERRWYVIDADGAVLGRLASEVAKLLRGKHKPIFAPHADTGDHVIVVNARKVRLTGGKEEKKIVYRHSGYPGGIHGVSYGRLMAERPARVVERAVRGMLPRNRLGRQMARKLAVYPGPEHPHKAQQPASLTLGQVPKWEGLPTPKPRPARPTPTEAEKKRQGRASAKAATAKAATAKAATAKAATAKTATRRTGAGAGARSKTATSPRSRKPAASAAAGPTEAKGAAPLRERSGRRAPSKRSETPKAKTGGSTEPAAKKSGRARRPKSTEGS
jgi:large subunit ribosomal protein L13